MKTITMSLEEYEHNCLLRKLLSPESVETYLRSLPWSPSDSLLKECAEGNIRTFARLALAD